MGKSSWSAWRVLSPEPELIICDEVTSAPDQVVGEEILKLMMGPQEETGVTFLFITHDINTARAIADEVIVTRDGRVVEQGPRPMSRALRITPIRNSCCPRCSRWTPSG